MKPNSKCQSKIPTAKVLKKNSSTMNGPPYSVSQTWSETAIDRDREGQSEKGITAAESSPKGPTFNGKSKETSVCMEHMSWLRAIGNRGNGKGYTWGTAGVSGRCWGAWQHS